MAVENWISQRIDELVEFRHDLHRNPELLYDLPRTAAQVAAALRAAGVDEVHEGLGKTGIVAVIRGRTNISGRTIGLRSDMDALPILEATGKQWASRTPGKMHACGHDGHATMLLGAAIGLAETRNFDGTVVLIFQPAEEGGAGARAMIEDGLFKRFPCDEVYGMHNRPGLPVGEFTIAPGPIMGSVDIFEIEIEGVGGHAAQPDRAIDPMPVMAALIQALQTIHARNMDPIEGAVISVTTVHGGDAHKVIPTSVRLTGTVRTLRESVRDLIETRMGQMVEGIALAFNAKGRLDYNRHYPVTVNHAAHTEYAAQAAESVAGVGRVSRDMPQTMGGEDFSFMLNEVPGAMINIGNGDSANLHNPGYDFDDDAIAWGVSYWGALVRNRLPLQA
ncbi:M20 aminoacylase family protein [Paracoccus sp. (in: a-proteobacteria)]|uniref:M20 aminoacylase family protein n=1 Tax=Paracoccus sp. TaxID=267 RepID=UPI0028A795B4|nr:M20 aminoacylase family protein [Paracoccus sp. (in: a-proteobacteria)]